MHRWGSSRHCIAEGARTHRYGGALDIRIHIAEKAPWYVALGELTRKFQARLVRILRGAEVLKAVQPPQVLQSEFNRMSPPIDLAPWHLHTFRAPFPACILQAQRDFKVIGIFRSLFEIVEDLQLNFLKWCKMWMLMWNLSSKMWKMWKLIDWISHHRSSSWYSF